MPLFPDPRRVCPRLDCALAQGKGHSHLISISSPESKQGLISVVLNVTSKPISL